MAPATRCRRGRRSPARCRSREVIRKRRPSGPEPRSRLAIRSGSWAARASRRGEGVRRGVGFAVGFKKHRVLEGFDDLARQRGAAVRRRGRRARRGGALCGGRGRPAPRTDLQTARTEPELENVVLAPGSTEAVGSSGSASASRMTWMAAGAQAARRAVRDELERRGGKPGGRRGGRPRADLPPPTHVPAWSRRPVRSRTVALTWRWCARRCGSWSRWTSAPG